MIARSFAAALILFCGGPLAVAADPNRCAVCGVALSGTVYTYTDKVTNEKKQVCHDCSVLSEECFICGLPVKTDYKKLPDGRFLCQRDAKRAVLDEDEAKRVCGEAKEAIDRLFSRFLVFPTTNVDTAVVDRVNLQELFKYPGRDYQCPNVLGYIQSKTNALGEIRHEISLLSGLPLAEFKAVVAHEYSHSWQFENVPAARKKTLGHDANEGFCELIAYLLMDSQSEAEQMKAIRANAYTRGQIDLFIEAERQFGLNQIIEWMKYGSDALLHADDLNRIRNIETPRAVVPSVTILPTYRAKPVRTVPDALVLRGISWAQDRPLAVINDRTFEIKEQGKVRVGKTNVMVRCLEIRTNSVLVQTQGSADKQELFLRVR
jgi:DNA-directed RNA polymerase subunit N (RpoN/RPB10)